MGHFPSSWIVAGSRRAWTGGVDDEVVVHDGTMVDVCGTLRFFIRYD